MSRENRLQQRALAFVPTDQQDDCYHSEFSALVDVLEGKIGSEAILSSYADALETYKLASPLVRIELIQQTFEIMTVGEKALRDRTT